MKIVHLCLCGPVTDNWNYQDNLLSKYHKRLGYDVNMITSKWVWNNEGKLELDTRTEYINDDGIKIIRLDILGEKHFDKKFKRYVGVYNAIESCAPDILFIHGCQFMDIDVVVEYLKRNKSVIVYLDNHADFSNSATNFISKNILHKIIWKSKAQNILPYVKKFYGVLPARVDFLVDIYQVPEDKVELLVMGADDDKVINAINNIKNRNLRGQFGIQEDDFLIVTGGKIDLAKSQTLLLMEAVKKIKNFKVKLIVFGSVAEELKIKFNSLIDNEYVHYAGWISAEESYDYFASADLVIFPGRHSVFWEQVAAQGIPMIVKYWEGTDHIDIGGNVRFLYEDSVEEIYKEIVNLIHNKNEYQKMKKISQEKGLQYFGYSKIATYSIK